MKRTGKKAGAGDPAMLQKLRVKFILTNMAFVTTVLVTVFCVLGYTNYKRLERENYAALRMTLTRERQDLPRQFGSPRRDEDPTRFLPVSIFSVKIGADGKLASVSDDYTELSDDEIASAAEAALQSGKTEGVLRRAGLRFLLMESAGGTQIAFADLSRERQSMGGFVLTALLIGALSLLAFFVMSLYLSRWALLPVKTAWSRQRQFVADASHELKTPVTVILANAGILLAHRADTIESRQKWVEYIREEAERMKKLIEDLLFLARSDDAGPAASHAPFALGSAVSGAVLPFESVAFEQGLRLAYEIEPGVFLRGSESEIRQLVAILLDNACKYADPGGCVFVSLEKREDKAVLRVCNTGEPIPGERLGSIFERFYRADESRSRENGGYGLGLAIAKRIAENHRGTIGVRSGEAEGTVFEVVLPGAFAGNRGQG